MEAMATVGAGYVSRERVVRTYVEIEPIAAILCRSVPSNPVAIGFVKQHEPATRVVRGDIVLEVVV